MRYWPPIFSELIVRDCSHESSRGWFLWRLLGLHVLYQQAGDEHVRLQLPRDHHACTDASNRGNSEILSRDREAQPASIQPGECQALLSSFIIPVKQIDVLYE